MTEPDGQPQQQTETSDEPAAGLLTIPNALCFIRLFGSPVLFALAMADRPHAFLWLYLFLAMTDWVDGKLAVLLNQRSIYGARLDSWADAAMYTALGFGILRLHWDLLQPELIWMAPAVGSYAASTVYGFVKFGRWPGYHTRFAKVSWLMVTIATITTLARWNIWPLRLAMVAVTLTNLEAMLITYSLVEWKADVLSWHGLRSQKATDPSNSGNP